MELRIEDAILFDAIFRELTNHPFVKKNVILEISQPIIWELNYKNETYLVYLLQDTSKQSNSGVITIRELLFSEVNETTVSKLMNSEISISDAFFTSDNIWRIGKIGSKLYPRKSLKSYKEIKDRFPRQGISLKDVQSI
ncbi:hypothetical protein P4T70_23790 [Bacillus mobilis]|uniref:hypothetical protein n=1 Tax=Bacillus mobilis TaxID=2026190 RepID=UPI002E235F7B|nr:hypothetical protein [Bacillus mobilis]